MDFLDPQKQRRHARMLLVGYILIGVAILFGVVILMYLAYGFGLGKNGEVVQNGLVFVSSAPNGAQIRLNGKLDKSTTNTRLSLESGQYQLQLDRTGYHSWQRTIKVVGGSVSHYDYPMLFPTQLSTTITKAYDSQPALALQSPDRRWLLIQRPDAPTTFDEFDLKNPKTAPTSVTLPSGIVNSGKTSVWQLMEWSNDNQHVLLKHTYDDKTEFIMVDRSDVTQSVNLNETLNTSPTKVSLINKKYDQYYVYDASSQVLSTATLNTPTLTTFLQHVIEYQSYGNDIMLYASSSSSGTSKVAIDLLQGGKTYNLREVNAGTTYLLNLTQYSGSWFVALGASNENKVYIYKNPVSQLNNKLGVLTPIYILKAPAPTYLSFSANAQYIMDENGSQFSVYDAHADEGFTYDTKLPLDAPQPHALWMDGNRLTYVSGNKLAVFDYDHANPQLLMAADPNYMPFFDTDYKFVYTLAGGAANKTNLTSTSLRTAADQ